MRLKRVCKDKFDVLAVCDDGGGCDLLEVLGDGSPASAQMLGHLRKAAERFPPPGAERCRPIRGKPGAHEIKAQSRCGLRVFCFRDGDRVICTHIMKKSRLKLRDYSAQGQAVLDLRATYMDDKRAGRMRIDDEGARHG